MHLIGVHQEPGAVIIHRKAEMVSDRLVHIQPLGPAKSGGKVHPVLPVVNIRSDLMRFHGGLLAFGTGGHGLSRAARGIAGLADINEEEQKPT